MIKTAEEMRNKEQTKSASADSFDRFYFDAQKALDSLYYSIYSKKGIVLRSHPNDFFNQKLIAHLELNGYAVKYPVYAENKEVKYIQISWKDVTEW